MRHHARLLLFALACLGCFSCLAQSTAFTYQGRLTTGTNAANGSFDLRFVMWDSVTAGSAVAGPATNAATAVSNGIFSVVLDFGSVPFNGANRWLEIGVRTNGAAVAFTILAPRQRLTATPYALQAAAVADASVTAAKLSSGVGASGQVLKMNGTALSWASDANSGGTVTSVTAGTGLTGGPITTSGSLSLDTTLVPRLAVANTFTASNTFSGVSTLLNAANRYSGTFSGNGAGISNVTANSTVSFTGSLAGDVTGTQAATTVARIRGVNVAAGAPAANQVLRYSGTAWTPSAVALATDVSGTLAAANGGSGLSSFAVGDLLYASAATTLSRRAIGSAGQVLSASGGVPIWTNANAHSHFGQTWSGADTDGIFVQNTSGGAGASAITGSATAGSGINYGVFGQSSSTAGIGVQGTAFAGTGQTTGVSGESASPGGSGVYGLASANNGSPTGVYGEAFSTNGIGVYGIGSAASGVPVGVYGEVAAPLGYGLYTPNDLYVGGAANIAGSIALFSGARIFADPGTPSAPGITFNGNIAVGLANPASNVLTISTASLERVRVAADGKLGIGRTPTANLLELAGEASKATAGSWLANSDARIKTQIASITNALEIIDQVRPVSFRYTGQYRHSHPEIEDKTYYNVVAQEFAKVFPTAVKNSGETLDGSPVLQVDTYPATIYSVAAIQELHRDLQARDAELKTLKQENAALSRRLEALEKKMANQFAN